MTERQDLGDLMPNPTKTLLAILAATIAWSGPVAQAEMIGCIYVPAQTEDDFPEPTFFESCAVEIAGGGLSVAPEHLANLSYDDDGLATLKAGGRHFYVNTQGESAAVVTNDNGPDRFVSNRARTLRDGKVGFIDKTLRLAIPARFDGAFPFDDGRALVCSGCKRTRDREGHGSLVGGLWGYIDRSGTEVVPIAYPCEKLDAIGGRPEWCLPEANKPDERVPRATLGTPP